MIANIEAENAIIAAAMLESSMVDRIADILTPDDFADPLISRMFRAVCESHAAGLASGPVVINNMFATDEAYKIAGGATFMANLTASSASMIGAVEMAKQVADLARRRRMVEGMAEASAMAEDQSIPLVDIVETADAAIGSASLHTSSVSQHSGAACLDEMMVQLDSRDQGVTCKVIEPFDHLLGGARRKQLIILAARPGMGKTAVALSYSVGAAMNGFGVLFVSLEMSASELGARMAADICFDGRGGVNYGDIINQRLSADDYRKLRSARDIAADLPLQVIDASSLSVSRLNVMVRRHARKMEAKGERLDLLIVDYLQLLSATKGRSAYETVSEISRALKAIAKEHDIAVIALAQLSREVEKRHGARPQLSDLRDSGQIEQDADTVMFLLRAEYYLAKEEPELHTAEHLKWEQAMSDYKGKIEFICAKRRNGETGKAFGAFHGAYQAVRAL